jgi:signal peptidase II
MAVIIIDLLCAAALVGIDQLLKAWAVQALAPVGAMPLIPHVIELRFVLNQGMAFSMLSGKQTLLILVTGVVLIGVAWYLLFRCKGRRLLRSALILVLAGGVGNLIDRVLNGEVVDYLNLLFMRFAVFNFADICVCVGVGLLILDILLSEASEHGRGEKGARP